MLSSVWPMHQADEGLRQAEGIEDAAQEHGDHHRRHDDRQEDQDAERLLAAEGEAAERIGGRQRQDEGERW